MKKLCFGTLLIGFCAALSVAQEIPKGVRYKNTTDETNNRAKTLLEQMLSKPASEIGIEDTFGKDAVMCGPFVWEAVGDAKSFNGATPVNLIVNGKVIQGRGIKDPEQKRLLWKRLLELLSSKGQATVRKANADEISFYWAMIPFDIEEPLLIADYGKDKLLVNFVVKDGRPQLFWIDLVRDLKSLK